MKRLTYWPQAVLGTPTFRHVVLHNHSFYLKDLPIIGARFLAGPQFVKLWIGVCVYRSTQEGCVGLWYMTVYTRIRLARCFGLNNIPLTYNMTSSVLSQDKKDDVQVGIRSTALLFGERTRPILSGLSLASLSLITYAGHLNAQGEVFYVGVGLAALQLARIIRRTDFDSRESCWDGFVGCGWAGFWIWMGALGDYANLMMLYAL